ncbi:unnamed protein product [Blepharisma stoltei]|uniref:Mitochondrial import inner membrane translocase subunit TIM50 n=1 Tax=Blepharisma stoltei TaxID=1481888 RepID=A0AAU9JH58_9CILI|nr:unnamed protein product [Blepharisma stoltei]
MSKNVKSALVSSKAPKPTTFSNERSSHHSVNPDLASTSPTTSKFYINLQDLVNLEEILSGLIIVFQQDKSASYEIERWWKITDENSIVRIDNLFQKEEVKECLREAIILEAVGVSLSGFLDYSALGNVETKLAINDLLELIHENFLVIIDIVLHRLPNHCSTNSWAVTLQAITFTKRKNKCSKYENINVLLSQNELIKGKIQDVAKEHTNPGAMTSRTARFLLYTTIQIVKDIESFEVLGARELLRTVINEYYEPPALNTTESIDSDIEIPLAEAPYLPETEEDIYTLVLDLDETLIHYYEDGDEGGFLIRPGCQEFLEEVSKLYEVIVFTAGLQEYADWVLDQIDPHRFISYRLYRQHGLPTGNFYTKDLSRLGRNIERVIIVDNMAENFRMQPDNGILIRTFIDDMTDNALLELLPLLKEIALKKGRDVRKALKSFRDQMMRAIARGDSSPHLNLHLEDDF